MAEILIKYRAEAGELQAAVNKINEANDEAVKSASNAADKIANEFKGAAKSAAAAFASPQIKAALQALNKESSELVAALKKLDDEQEKLIGGGKRLSDEFKKNAAEQARLKKEISNVNNELKKYETTTVETTKKTEPLTRTLRGLKNELNLLEEQGKADTEQFRKLTLEAARLEDQIGDTRTRIGNLASDTLKFDAGLQAVQGLAAGFEVAQGAAALFGAESEDLEKAILKVQGAMAIANGVQQISELLLEESKLKTQALTTAQRVYAAVVGTTSGALKGLRVALAATGVGALIVGIGLLITYFDDLMDAIKGTSDTSRSLGNALNESKTAIAGAVEETQKVGNAFELARQGVISKEEALLTYNETLGDSFGRTTDLNKAEENFVKKSAAYVKAAQIRATAQALTAEAATLAAEAATISGEEATNFGEKIATFSADLISGFNQLIGADFTAGLYKAERINIQQNAQLRVKAEKQAQADRLFEVANGFIKEAELLENQVGIASEAEQKVNEARDAKRKEGADKAAEAAKKAEEDAKKARERLAQIENEAFVTQLTEQQKIRAETNEKILELEKTFTEARFKAGTVEALRAEKEKNDAIDQLIADRDKRIKELDKKALEESVAKQIEATKAAANATTEEQILALQTQRDIELANAEKLGKDKVEITTRYNTQIADLNKQLAQSEYNTRVDNLKALELIEGSTLERRLELINIEAERRKKEAKDTIKDKKELDAKLKLIEAETQAAIREEQKKTRAEQIAQVEEVAQATAGAFSAYVNLVNQISEQRINAINQSSELELKAINDSQNSEITKERQRETLKLKTERAIAKEKTKQATLDKQLALFNAIISTAAAIAKVSSNPVLVALAAATGALQIATIASQPIPKYARGGLIGGRLHSGGGTLIEAERDEYIINRAQSMKHRRELDAINTSSEAFRRLIDERYVRPAINYYLGKKERGLTLNASLNSKSMERELKGMRRDLKRQNTVININASDNRYTWQ